MTTDREYAIVYWRKVHTGVQALALLPGEAAKVREAGGLVFVGEKRAQAEAKTINKLIREESSSKPTYAIGVILGRHLYT